MSALSENEVGEVWSESVELHRAPVERFVRRLVGDEALAEDLCQETFLRATRSSSSHRGEARLRSWLCAIALNLVRDHYRALERRPALATDPALLDELPSGEDLETAVQKAEMAGCIGEYLSALPEPQCQVVALHDMAELTHAEIAELVGISVANSRVVLHRGRARLRELLRRNCILSPGDTIPCQRRP